jgi:hypothetical protein
MRAGHGEITSDISFPLFLCKISFHSVLRAYAQSFIIFCHTYRCLPQSYELGKRSGLGNVVLFIGKNWWKPTQPRIVDFYFINRLATNVEEKWKPEDSFVGANDPSNHEKNRVQQSSSAFSRAWWVQEEEEHDEEALRFLYSIHCCTLCLEVASRLLWKSKELESHILQLIVALLTFKSLLFIWT